MTAAEMRDIDPRDRRAWADLPTELPVGAWVVTPAGEFRVEEDGTITPRPTPIPWSRPSVAAIPTVGRAP